MVRWRRYLRIYIHHAKQPTDICRLGLLAKKSPLSRAFFAGVVTGLQSLCSSGCLLGIRRLSTGCINARNNIVILS